MRTRSLFARNRWGGLKGRGGGAPATKRLCAASIVWRHLSNDAGPALFRESSDAVSRRSQLTRAKQTSEINERNGRSWPMVGPGPAHLQDGARNMHDL